MSPTPTRRAAVACWNCETPTMELIEAVLRASSGRGARVPLCSACYAGHYRPLDPRAAEVAPATNRASKILVIEDDPDICRLVSVVLEDTGFNVDTAADGQEALIKAGRDRPDAIVLDLQLPVVSGQDFLRVWRAADSGDSVPVVAMSARHGRATAATLGVEAFVPKPLDLHALVDTLNQIL